MRESKIPYEIHRSGEKAIIFIHGFLDSGEVWKSTIENIDCPSYESVTLDLPAMGRLSDYVGPLDLYTLRDAALEVIDAVNKPCVLVGHSMGCQIAELAAAKRPGSVQALVFLAPVPLGGTPCDQGTIDMMHAIGRNRELQFGVRKQLCPEMTDEQVLAHMEIGLQPTRENAGKLFDTWSTGLPEGKEPSAFRGKVHIITGTADPFANPAVVNESVAPRFADVSLKVLDGASHWAQFTLGKIIGDDISAFIAEL